MMPHLVIPCRQIKQIHGVCKRGNKRLAEQMAKRQLKMTYECNNCAKRFKSETWADKHTGRRDAEGKQPCPNGMSYVIPLRLAK